MSETNPDITELLRRYLSGAITAPEEAELERLARTDETLREAMQGLQSAPEEDHLVRIERMKARVRQQAGQGARPQVQEKVRGKEDSPGSAVVRPIKRYRYYAAAAVMLLLATAVFLLPRFQEKALSTDLAMETEASQEAPAPEPAPSLEPEQAAGAEAPTPPAAKEPAPDPRPVAQNKPEPAASRKEERTSALVEPATPIVIEDDGAVFEEEVMPAEAAAPPPPPSVPATIERADEAIMMEEVTPETELSAKATGSSRNQRREMDVDDAFEETTTAIYSNGPATLTGRVTTENGEPIFNALVRQPGLPIGIRTDSNGVFSLQADATATLLDISHPDFNEERVDVKSLSEKLQITLEQEKKVSYEEWKKSWESTKIPLDDTPGYALPEEGYNALRQRIEENKPVGIPSGKVKLSFLVNPDGTLEDFVFRGRPEQATMDYIGTTIMQTSIWNVVKGKEPVRVYFKVVFE